MIKRPEPIKYTSRDYTSIRQDLVNYARNFYSDIIGDFTSNSFNSFMFDAVAYVGDILSYYLDYQANESFLSTATEYVNILKLGEELGYKFANTSAASQGIVKLIVDLPVSANGSIDTRYNPILKKFSTIISKSGKVFTLMDDVDMNNSSAVRQNNFVQNKLVSQRVTNYGKVISGEIVQKTFSIGQFAKFLKINLEDPNITEILDVYDSEGNFYYQVDYLSQNVIYKPMLNTNSDSNSVNSIMRLYSVPRRFIVEKSLGNSYMIFGANNPSNSEGYKDILAEPSKFILQVENKKYFSDNYFDPNSMITSDKLGIGPANTTITVLYRSNSESNVNISTGDINGNIQVPIVEFKDPTILLPSEIRKITNSFYAINIEPIVGSVDSPTTEELKIRIKNNFAAQNRAVTLKDYEALCYSMPAKFGNVKRVRALKDIDAFKRNINLHVISQDANGNFFTATNTLKNNLKIWIEHNKMIMDTVDILDAKIINLKIDYVVKISDPAKRISVLSSTKNELIDFFSSRKPEIGESLSIIDIQKILYKVDDVEAVSQVSIFSKTGIGYSNIYFDVQKNMSQDGNSIVIPKNCVYEIKNLEVDIQGKAEIWA